jgi:hypothetical protein
MGTPVTDGPLVATLVLVVLAAVIARARRASILALSFLLIMFALESAVHSVHHLSDSAQAENCAVASAAANVSAVDAGETATPLDRLVASGTVMTAPTEALSSFRLPPPQSRAPPGPIA